MTDMDNETELMAIKHPIYGAVSDVWIKCNSTPEERETIRRRFLAELGYPLDRLNLE
jgi:hypothetical protein